MKLVWVAIVSATIALAPPVWAQETAPEASEEKTEEAVEEKTAEAAVEPEASDETKKDDKKEEAKAASDEEGEKAEEPAATEEAALEAIAAEKKTVAAPAPAAVTASAAAVTVTEEEAEEEDMPPWAGSSITYGNLTSLVSSHAFPDSFCTEQDAANCVDSENNETTGRDGGNTNPYYGMSLTLSPVWVVADWLTLSGGLSFIGELTLPDSDPTPFNIGNLSVNLGFGELFEIPGVDVGVSASVANIFGTSEVSRTHGHIASTYGSLTFSKSLEVLGGLSLSYTPTLGLTANKATTSSATAYDICVDGSQPATNSNDDITAACGEWQSVGLGSPSSYMGLSHSFSVGLSLNDMFSLSAGYELGQDFSYQTSATEYDDNQANNTDPTQIGYSQGVSLGLRAKVLPYMTVSAGVKSAGPQLQPSGTYYKPLLSKLAKAYLNITITPAALLAEASDS